MSQESSLLPSWAQTHVGYFANVQSGKAIGRNIALADALTDIKNGKHARTVAKLRDLSDAIENPGTPAEMKAAEEEYDRLKRTLPAIMVSATTRDGKHTRESVEAHSGLLQADIDGLPSLKAAEALRDRLQEDPFIGCATVSPGGRGVKAFVRVPADIDGHSQAWQAVADHFRDNHKVEIDEKPKNPASLCFLSADSRHLVEGGGDIPCPGGRGHQAKEAEPPTHTQDNNSSEFCVL